MNDFIKNLKPGDTVIRQVWNWTGCSYFEAKVSHITPKGFINVDGYLFKSDGYCRAGGQKLIDPNDAETQKVVAEYKRDNFVKSILRKMWDCKKLSYEQAVKIHKILKEESK